MSERPNAPAVQSRRSKRAAIEAFFREHLGERFDTMALHTKFGTSFRARVSEINRDPRSTIRILNATSSGHGADGQPCERSVYWAEPRASAECPPERVESAYMRRVPRGRSTDYALVRRIAPMIEVRIHLETPGELPWRDKLTILRGQLRLIVQQAERGIPITVESLARAERVACSLELAI